MTTVSVRYARLLRFHERWKALIQIALGVLWTATSIFLAVIALLVFAEQEERAVTRAKEAKTVRVACTRAKEFGPPFIEFLERAEAQLHLGALTQLVTIDGKREPVIAFYRSTIPPSCPK